MAQLSLSELEQSLKSLELSTPVPPFPSAEVLSKPLDLFRSYLADILISLVECDPIVAYNSVQLSNDPLQGDLTVVLPRLCPGAKPSDIAQDLRKRYPSNPLFDLPWDDGVYLRFCIKSELLPRFLLPYINERGRSYGNSPAVGVPDVSSPDSSQRKVVIEFSSPNIATEFQGKHLRSTILGSYMSNIHKLMGWEVTNVNYLGDWGKDLALFCVGWKKFGSEEEYEKDPSGHIFNVYQKIHELFLPEQAEYRTARDEAKKSGKDEAEVEKEFESRGLHEERNTLFMQMEEGNEEALVLFKRIRDLKIKEYENFYARLNIEFQEYFGESLVSQEIITEVERLLDEKNISEESEGKKVIDMKKHGGKAGMAIIRDRAGGSTYFLRYLAAVLQRYRNLDFDKMIFVAADRTGHFARLIKVFEALDMSDLASKLQPVLFSDLSHMAEQLGHSYQPHRILDDCEKATTDILRANDTKFNQLGSLELLSQALATSALLVQELSTKRGSDHIFDISTMTSFKSGTGLDIQHQYSQLSTFINQYSSNVGPTQEDYSLLTQDNHTSLLLLLGQYPEVVHTAYESLEPSYITTYLRNVVEQLSYFLDDDENEEQGDSASGEPSNEENETDDKYDAALLALYKAAQIVLENGMRLLGITPITHLQPPRTDTPVAE